MLNHLLPTLGIGALLISTLMGNVPPSFAQNLTNSSSATTLILTSPQGKELSFPLSSSSYLREANIIATSLLAMGTPPETITVALELVQAGGNPETVLTLIQKLQSLVTEQDQIKINQLNDAISAYNQIVDNSDLQTLQNLKNLSDFQDIKNLLEILTKAAS